MYIKAVGFLLLLLGGGMTGMKKAQALSETEKVFLSLREGVQIFKNEIEYKTEILERAIEKAALHDRSGIFSESLKYIREHGASKGFIIALEKNGDRQIKEIMSSFGRGLDAEDKDGLLENIHFTALRLDEEIKKATEIKGKLYKMYVTTGFLAGAAVGIMFI